MNPDVQGFFDPATFTVSYIVHDLIVKCPIIRKLPKLPL